jgi:hypothetical protein
MIDLRDRAIQAALNFAGRTISSSDGTFDLLVTVIQGALQECAKDSAEKMRARCLDIVGAWTSLTGPESSISAMTARKIERKIRVIPEGVGHDGFS